MLVDEVTINVRGGKGGDGKVAFIRNSMTAKGGPDGGNGGNGGSVYFTGTDDITALSEFRFKKKIHADDGVPGGKKNLYGKNAEDLIVKVPLGTHIEIVGTKRNLEITSKEKHVLIARGGHGGRGNNEFKSATNQTPQEFEYGEQGEVFEIRLVLRLIADIGFIGLPNAGKSSLLSVLTNARPKIGDYPFTTLEPNLGVFVVGSDASHGNKGFVLADIPGLIEGASVGRGLGVKFLKHTEKTKMLIHCIDLSSDDIKEAYETVRKELESYSMELAEKEEIILLTKTDLVENKKVQDAIDTLEYTRREILTVSLYDEESITRLKTVLGKMLLH